MVRRCKRHHEKKCADNDDHDKAEKHRLCGTLCYILYQGIELFNPHKNFYKHKEVSKNYDIYAEVMEHLPLNHKSHVLMESEKDSKNDKEENFKDVLPEIYELVLGTDKTSRNIKNKEEQYDVVEYVGENPYIG